MQRLDPADGDEEKQDSAVKDPSAVCNGPVESTGTMSRKTVNVDGEVFLKYPVSVTTQEHLRNLRNMTLRDDDVILAAFPKSGTHWLWEVTHMLTSGRAEYDPRDKSQLMAEFTEVARLDALPSPRIINSHLFLRHLSKEVVTKRVRVLHVLRNFKDVVVSHYFHMRQRDFFTDEGFEAYARFYLRGCEIPGSYVDYFAYLQEMEAWQKEHPQVPFLNVCFEDMKEKPMECVKDLAEFLGVAVTPSLCEEIVQACSFQQLQRADLAKDNPAGRLFKGGKRQLFRKGQVGDWKNHFTVALSEEFDDVIAERLQRSAFLPRLRYTL
ncbi:sulfotransferase 2A1-like [Babylonia areolata]|uniref:sulfotransferase 2A1-like n=1 Tax=Babylonia areolata TaxID=304850 RepID=UPI003FD59C4F